MNFKRDLLLGVGALVAILLVVCFGSIGLLARMSPAIEHVLEENDESLEAIEEMLTVLAESGHDPVTEAGKGRFREALERVRKNVTEEEEKPEIEAIGDTWEAAVSGDGDARKKSVAALGRLAKVNRQAMHRANHEAQRLGWAGAWATVLLCMIGFGAALVVTRRLDARILQPIAELNAVLQQAKDGGAYRRCTLAGASPDVSFVMRSVNELLDRQAPESPRSDTQGDGMRTALLRLLDESEHPRVLIDARGRMVAANRSALDRAETEAWRDARAALERALEGDVQGPVRECLELDGGLFLCTLES
jgi:hypothetical protein